MNKVGPRVDRGLVQCYTVSDRDEAVKLCLYSINIYGAYGVPAMGVALCKVLGRLDEKVTLNYSSCRVHVSRGRSPVVPLVT